MKKTLLFLFGIIFSINVNAQFFTENFDGATTPANLTLTNGPCNDGTADYFGVVCLTGTCPDGTIGSGMSYGGVSGGFLGAQNSNAEAGCNSSASLSATLGGINISGQTNMTLCFDIAEDDDGTNQDWDASSTVSISYDIDAGGANELVDVRAVAGTNTEPAFDCSGNGAGDGAVITSTFTTYCISIPATGASMDLIINIGGLDAGDEDIAIDNIEIFSDGNGTPSGALPCAVCGATLGTPTFTCLANTAGADGVTVNIPYTGSDAGITSVTTTSGGTITGDDPATVADGTITITGLNEGDAWDILLNGGDCDGTTDSGTISATECPAALVCPNVGDLIITEIMYNPSGAEPATEWFEVCNVTGADIDMNGMEIGDNAVTNHTISSTLNVPAGGCVVIAHTSVCNGITPDYTHGAFSLNQAGDDVEIICGGTTIDVVTYDGGATFPSESDGESIQFDPAATQNSTANDTGSNWCVPLATTMCGASDLGSPGVANSACTLPPCMLVVTVGTPECATNTSLVDVYSVDIDFTGGGADVFTINPGVAGASVVFEDNPDTDAQGKFTIVDIPEGTNLSFTITSTNGCSIPVAATSPTCDCIGVGGGSCNDVGNITITEIMYDPCSSGSNFWPSEGDGEYVEICNCGVTAVDISKWQLRDEASRGDGIGSSFYTFPDMTELAAGECAVVANTPVYIALSPAAGYQLFDKMNSNAELDNSGATATNEAGLYLIAFDGTLIDEVVWDDPNAASPAFPSCAGQNDGISLVLMDCSLDNSVGANWYPSLNGGDGVAGGGTPGTANTAAACIDNVTLSVSPACNGDDAEFTVSFDYSYAYLNPNITFDIVRTDGGSEVVLGTSSAQTASSGTGVTIMGTVAGPTAAGTATVEVRVTGQPANSCFMPEVDVIFPTCPMATSTCPTGCSVVISEIMYNPASDESSGAANNTVNEWIEIVNTTGATIDMGGWIISDVGDGTYTIPSGTTIGAGVVMIFGEATLAEFNAAWGPGFTSSNYTFLPIKANFSRLGNSPTPTNEHIRITCADGSTIIDEVNYDDLASAGWPSSSNGFSIYLDPCATACATTLADNICAIDNNAGASWSISVDGTNGAFEDLGTGLPFDGDDVGSPGTICEDSDVLTCTSDPLPVELVFFNARKENNSTLLTWQTASEENNDFFSVEHSVDGIIFREIGTVNGAGTTLEIQNYQYVHATPSIGTNYYRLRQVDYSEEFAYSNIEVLVFEENNNDVITIRPTVGKNIVTLITNKEFSNESNILIYNSTGTLVREMSLVAGSTELEINISDLSAGHYFVKVIGDNISYNSRFIKQ